MTNEEQHRLLDELLDGVISEADFLRLEAEMHVSEAARQQYYERLKLHTALQLEAEGKAPQSKVVRFADWRSHGRLVLGLAAAVLILLAGSLGWRLGQGGDPLEVVRTEPAATGFGVVSEELGAVWEQGISLGRGDLVPVGPLTLSAGTAQLELFSGVVVVVEGSAEFEILSPMEMSVIRGKIRALVPKPAQGFRVHTATGDVVDLGTEFAIEVTEDQSDIHVLDGEVEWHPRSRPMQRVNQGESIRWRRDGGGSELPFDAGQIGRMGDVEARLASQREQRRQLWQEQSRRLAEDRRVVAYFPMNQTGQWQRQLQDASPAGRDGAIVAARRVSDRWGKEYGALDFGPTGSRVRLNIPGEYRSITLYCWVKIDSLDRWYNSLFLTDGHELGEPHWQIMDDGRLFFSVKRRTATKNLRDKQIVFSPSFWTPSLSGKWVQLATAFDADARKVTHYLNGEVLHQETIADEYFVDTVRIGGASIGNWSDPTRADDPHFAIRNLNGSMDEFAIFNVALEADEIAELYQNGKP